MRRAVRARAILAAGAVGFCVWGCGLGGEQQFQYSISNDSSRAVIVRFGSYGEFAVPPGRSGRGASSFGILGQAIEILDQQCRVLESVEPTTHSGSLWIRDDMPARLSELDWDDHSTHLLDQTDRCER